MTYACIQNGILVKYPYTITDLRRDNRNISFAKLPDAEVLATYGIVAVFDTPVPVTTDKQILVEKNPTYNPDLLRWEKVWTVRDLTQEELAERAQAKRANMVVSPFQAKAAMMAANIYSAAETIIQNSEDATLKLAWEYAIEWRRLSPAVTGLAAALNLSDEELDELFEAAALIEA